MTRSVHPNTLALEIMAEKVARLRDLLDDPEWYLGCDRDGVVPVAAVRAILDDDVESPMPNKPRPGETARAVRVPDPLWNAAKEKAAERGETVSDVIRRALERYVKR